MAYAVCIGLAVATVAGIAYGYNYSLAEFVTFTRSDVTVYMRRGQFYDRPDVIQKPGYRRSGYDEVETSEELPSNNGIDYEESTKQNTEIKSAPLSDSWQKVQDTREYAERLMKYEHSPSYNREVLNQAVQAEVSPDEPLRAFKVITIPTKYYKLTTPPLLITKLTSITPNVIMSTAILHSGSSQIVMRNFQPIEEEIPTRTTSKFDNTRYRKNQVDHMDTVEEDSDNTRFPVPEFVLRRRPVLNSQPELKEKLKVPVSNVGPKKSIMQQWSLDIRPTHKDYPVDDTVGNIVNTS